LKIKLQISGNENIIPYLIYQKHFLFRFAFPFGRPDGALKATLSLLERVLTKDAATPITREDIRYFIRKCLENAAYTNYTRVSDQAKIEGNSFFNMTSIYVVVSGERENQQQNDNGNFFKSFPLLLFDLFRFYCC
jgi:hypothetical protein